MQRLAQVRALRSLHAEACGHAAHASAAKRLRGPFQPRPRPAAAILAGDFNCRPGSEEYQLMTARCDVGCPSLVDAWSLAHPNEPHAPTAGLFESSWAKQPLCCDFVFVTEDIAKRVRNVVVDTLTQASDHQPVLVEFNPKR
jgi:endonuclease/exonuclease/phosphatase family metal-dependent hydrolase